MGVSSTFTIVSGASVTAKTTSELSLSQNYPNPFSSVTTFDYFLPSDGKATLKIIDLMGRTVMTAIDDYETGGEHQRELELRGSPEGVYVAELTFIDALGVSRSVRRMVSLIHSLQR